MSHSRGTAVESCASSEELARQRLPIVSVRSDVAPVHAPYCFVAETLTVTPRTSPDLVDITATVQQVVERSQVLHGQVFLFSSHTTATVVVNEDEPLLREDICDFLERLASSTAAYRHDNMSIRTENLILDHGRNAHAHLKCLALGSSVTLPVLHGKLALGAWQRIFVLEMDAPKPRTVRVQVCGVGPQRSDAPLADAVT